ncbi:hypothetical protein KUL42_16820 [Alteromonas sp. KUL42]|uniref:hypothetical protein n=1 Tax=Alteromonas sp. KUL42 TaxID=2480797 RepID=UPI001036673F|nr:hypothetical protein [Alteromonas sp. KUL42]TAP36702.1 hypothetical protein EYR97_08300 [Alteromonas sp. KUL42]GEA06921.1 hypothetical protein KUL42_16820 [Alteromonas sp. KUL42]
MSNTIKSKIPLLFLIVISLWWGFYYQSNSTLNAFGNANFEWLFLLDAFISLPIVCFLCIKDKKEALLKSLVFMCLAVLIGSYVIPEQNKLIWPYLESGRYIVVALFLLFEITAMVTVYLAIKVAIKNCEDPDLSIEKPIKKYLGESIVASLLCFEIRMWTFTLFYKQVKPENFNGKPHFTYHNKDGAHSNLLGFIFIIAFEIPIMHLFLHFIWSPFAANIITLLTAFSVLFFLAEYRAISRRPISLVGSNLVIRYGLYQPLTIPINNIAKVEKNSEFVKRSRSVKRYNYAGFPNVAIKLAEPMGKIERIVIGVDNAEEFISAINSRQHPKTCTQRS